MSILVTGSGALASALSTLSTADLPIVTLSRKEMDIRDKYKVHEIIKKHANSPEKPSHLIHTAALTKPMDCNEKNPELSIKTNIGGTVSVATACQKYGIKFRLQTLNRKEVVYLKFGKQQLIQVLDGC